jgi:hypothetical protein
VEGVHVEQLTRGALGGTACAGEDDGEAREMGGRQDDQRTNEEEEVAVYVLALGAAHGQGKEHWKHAKYAQEGQWARGERQRTHVASGRVVRAGVW